MNGGGGGFFSRGGGVKYLQSWGALLFEMIDNSD